MSERDSLSSRLSARSQGLARRQMPGGGEAFTGGLANQALGAIGARAMTMDNTVFMQDNFNSSDSSDLALWAHESHHQNESGGSDNHSEYDSEEQAARARERMVLQASEAGHDPDQILGRVDSADPKNAGEADSAFAALEGNASEDAGGEPDPMEAYRNMMRDGMQHHDVVRNLAEHLVRTRKRQRSEQGARSAGESDVG